MHRVLGDRRAAILLMSPALAVYTLVMLVPVLWSLGYTFFSGSPVSGFTFAGLDNLSRLFSDPQLAIALRFTLTYAVVVTLGQVLLGYLLALFYVFVLRRASAAVRTLLFFPVVLPTVAIGVLFQRMFQLAPQRGLVNSLAELVGLDAIDWFGQFGTAFFVLALMDVWRAMGFYAVLLYAGLLDIPQEVLESARIDGAGSWRLVRHIVLPLSVPILVACLVFSINGTLKVFDSVLALTDGGPGTSTTPLTVYMYRTAFNYSNYGYGSSIALLLTLLCLAVTLAIFRVNRANLKRVEQ